MHYRRIFLIVTLLYLSLSGFSQITSFVGGSVFPSISKTRNDNTSFSPGLGGGITYVFWEYPNWFIRTGMEYVSRSSGVYEIPRYFDLTEGNPLEKTDMVFTQQNIVVPISLYYIPFRKKGNAMLVLGGMDIFYVSRMKFKHDDYGLATLSGTDIDQQIIAGLTLGAGYQRELSDILFINIYADMDMDIRADRPFQSFELKIELIYGIY